MTETRPDITAITTSQEMRRWYWTKDELTDRARGIGLRVSGGKFDLLDRICTYLDTGEVPARRTPRRASTPAFDWHAAPLSPDTVLTDSYRHTQNVRRFFKAQVGDSFKFNIAFMDWLKANTGKTLGDAVAAYHQLKNAAKDPAHKTQIRDHNQFNQYTRDILAANPGMPLKEVRRIWALKRARPSDDGRHKYHPDDLSL